MAQCSSFLRTRSLGARPSLELELLPCGDATMLATMATMICFKQSVESSSGTSLLEKERNRYYLVLASRETGFPGEFLEGQGKSSLKSEGFTKEPVSCETKPGDDGADGHFLGVASHNFTGSYGDRSKPGNPLCVLGSDGREGSAIACDSTQTLGLPAIS